MALMGLQGLTPLGGSSGYGLGQPPNGDGTDPNDQQNQNPQRRPQNGAPSSSQGPQQGPQNSAPTFAELQQQGRARPAPPQMGGMGGSLMGQTQQAASQALANPSAYGAPQVQQAIDALNQNLAVQDTLGKQQIDQTMAARGLYDSTEAGRQYGLLAQAESAQRAQLAANLSQQVAQTYGQDRAAAIQSALATQGQQFGQGLSEQQLALQQALGYGGLGLQAQQQAQNYALGAGSLTGNFGGQSTLAAQQQAIQNQQFQQQLGLQSQLGLGQLGVAQQQAATQQAGTLGNLALGQQQLSQQGSQFGQSLALQQQQQAQNYALGLGGLGVQQQQAQTAAQAQQAEAAYQQGQLGLGQGQLSLAQLQNLQQYGLQGAQLSLAQQKQLQDYQIAQGQLGVAQQQAQTQQAGTLGNLALGQQQLGQQASQFGQTFGLQQLENQQQYGLSQQQLALQQALGYGNLGVAQQQAETQRLGTTGNLALGQQQLAQQGSQFGQSLSEQQRQFNAQNALASALGYGNLGVAQQQANTQQRQVEGQLGLGQGQLSLAQLQNAQQYGISQEQLAQQQAYQAGQLGLGQQQINASLLNEQRQVMGNLAYAGIMNSTPDHPNPPPAEWLNFLLSNQGQTGASPYQLPSWAWGSSAPSYGPPQAGGQIPGGGGRIGDPSGLGPTYGTMPVTMPTNRGVMQALGYNDAAPQGDGYAMANGAGTSGTSANAVRGVGANGRPLPSFAGSQFNDHGGYAINNLSDWNKSVAQANLQHFQSIGDTASAAYWQKYLTTGQF